MLLLYGELVSNLQCWLQSYQLFLCGDQFVVLQWLFVCVDDIEEGNISDDDVQVIVVEVIGFECLDELFVYVCEDV